MMTGEVPLCDAHSHMGAGEEAHYEQLLARGALAVAFSVSDTDSEECRAVRRLVRRFPGRAFFTAGIHPWDAEHLCVDSILPHLEEAALIGEIGLDCGWTDADPDCQRTVFQRQLDIARQTGKGVVLHMHGREAEAAEMVGRYELPCVLVHWYAGEPGALRRLREQGAYFSVGPDFEWNPAVREVVRTVALDRLLVETDGSDALRWATRGREADVTAALDAAVRYIAREKGVSPGAVRQAVFRNFQSVYMPGERSC